MLDNDPAVGAIQFRGKPLDKDAADLITSATIEMGTDQVTELSMSFDDPGFRLLDQRIFDLDTVVRYRGLHLHIAVLETDAGGGLGGITIKCRPTAVRKLKQLRGRKVRHNITPGVYLVSECELADVAKRPVVQHSQKKKKIVRDVEEAGASYDPSDIPSAWTTTQRLAGEIGFYVYEVGGVIYFGRPTWLVKKQPKVMVDWYDEGGNEPLTIPQIRHSIDSEDIEVTLTLPLRRAGEVIPGKGLALRGFPKYSDTYFITNVSYPLAGKGESISVTATTVRNPEPQPSGGITIPGQTSSDNDYSDLDGPRELARAICAQEYGWGDNQFAALNQLWTKESGWNYKAVNPSSGATGIPQALPGNKMASEGADWRTNPETQIRWGLKYIKGRYGTPIGAWNAWQSKGWY